MPTLIGGKSCWLQGLPTTSGASGSESLRARSGVQACHKGDTANAAAPLQGGEEATTQRTCSGVPVMSMR